ncbi:MAG: deoxyribodipyrimidine photo-lyase, partial [Ottowia sp.]|nr:deoxyribodipyrimidine photo-lyase [Ottowia sp.]
DPLLVQGLQADRRVEFIHASLLELDGCLRAIDSGLIVRYGVPRVCIPALAKALEVDAVWANRDDEPSAIARDRSVEEALRADGCLFFSFYDHLILPAHEVLTALGKPFSVFTPYKNAWLRRLTPAHLAARVVNINAGQLAPVPISLDQAIPSLAQMGFEATQLLNPAGMSGAKKLLSDFVDRMDRYHIQRDYPGVRGVSYLSVHLRFGTISIRTLARLAHERMLVGDAGASTWLSELIWRDFYFMILHYHPRLAEGEAFKPIYDAIAWEQGEHAQTLFHAWCAGRTGYPLVDAAMCQLNQTGFMHNRLRMLVASFLIKDLGIDWRWGERYFAQQLNDFDFSANNGGWQWAASSGCDAQPYFRIFNPVTQSEKYDAQGKFIRRYVPVLAALPDKWIHTPWCAPSEVLQSCAITLGENYPYPLVAHQMAREQTLARYAVVKGK